MRRLKYSIMILIFMFSNACGGLDLKGAAGELADALNDGSCKTLKTLKITKKNDKNNGQNQDDSSDDSDDYQDDTASNAVDDSTDCGDDTSDFDNWAGDDESDSSDDDGYDYAADDDSGALISDTAISQAGWVFVGTYIRQDAVNDCHSKYGNHYDFPTSLRAFAYDDKVDFLTSGGDLAFRARTFPDETFDFTAYFANAFGQPTIEVDCTCAMNEDYYYYDNNGFDCACDPSNNDPSCREVYKLQ